MLSKINDPMQIKELKLPELKKLASDVRKRMIEVVSKTGGHIAPSLGTVELTISLLYTFDPLVDRIVWDVGHQSYAWKILTGRNDRFDTLRSLGGISGFTNRDESPYDAFTTGHSSTSVSAALGLACAAELKGEEEPHHIAVIGDGALTGGISFEALNHTGHLQMDRFIVVLNDNAMSISKNVGGLQKHMAHLMASRSYNTLKQQIWALSGTLPDSIRRRFIYGAQKLEESMMNILVPNILFEDLGFKYVGPIDGHDLKQLNSIFKRVRDNMVGPVLVHVVTQKGKGYKPAEKDAALFHGVGPFEFKSGKQTGHHEKGWSEVFGEQLCHLAVKNQDIVAITAAMSAGTGLSGFEEQYPERFFDVGIAEQHAVTLAAGMACRGLKPFVAIYSTFLQRALDQVIHDVALPRLPVVFCIDRAGIVGEDGATHQGAFDIAYLLSVPNLVMLAPSSAEELKSMMNWAAMYKQGPVSIRYPRGMVHCANEAITPFKPGKAHVLEPEGDIALVSVGDTLTMVEQIHETLAASKVKARIIDLRSIKPMDEELLHTLAEECTHIFTFETGAVIGGAGSRITQLLCDKACKVINFGYPDRFIPHGKIEQLNQEIGFTAEALSKRILETIKP